MGQAQFYIAGMIDLSGVIGSPNPVAAGTDTLFKYHKGNADAIAAIKALPVGAAQWGGTTTSAQANTLLNITGSGWLYGVRIPGTESSPGNVSIQIDGGTVHNISGSQFHFMPVRFEASLLVKSSGATPNATNYALAVLD